MFFGTRASLGPSTRDFTPGTYVEVQQATIRNLRPVMGTLLPAAVTATVMVLVLLSTLGSPLVSSGVLSAAIALPEMALSAVVKGLPVRMLQWGLSKAVLADVGFEIGSPAWLARAG